MGHFIILDTDDSEWFFSITKTYDRKLYIVILYCFPRSFRYIHL